MAKAIIIIIKATNFANIFIIIAAIIITIINIPQCLEY